MRSARNKILNEQFGLFSFLLLVWLLAFLLALPVKGAPPIDRATRETENLRVWQGLSPERQRELSDRFLSLLRLPADQRNLVMKRFRSWRQRPESERAEIRRRFLSWRRLPDAERVARRRQLLTAH